jgi:RNA polymerase sigma-70 factor, ECF subfamily
MQFQAVASRLGAGLNAVRRAPSEPHPSAGLLASPPTINRESRAVLPPYLPRIAQGDSLAVEACLQAYSGLVWNIARKSCRDTQDAEDLAQDVFVELWRSAQRFDPELSSEVAFVAMVARRRAIDRSRRQGRRGEAAELDEQIPDSAPSVFEQAALSDEAALAQSLLKELKPDQVRVLELALIEGLSHPEIANQTGLPLGTVKTHARRGLQRAREALDSLRRKKPQ